MEMHLEDEVMAKAEKKKKEEIDEDIMILMQDGDEGIEDGHDLILDWEPLVEIPILDDAPRYESNIEDFWSRVLVICPLI